MRNNTRVSGTRSDCCPPWFSADSAVPRGTDRQSLLRFGTKRTPAFPVLVKLATRTAPSTFRLIPIGRRKLVQSSRVESFSFSSLPFASTLSVLALLAALLGALRFAPPGLLPSGALACLALAFALGALGKSRMNGASEGVCKSLDRGL